MRQAREVSNRATFGSWGWIPGSAFGRLWRKLVEHLLQQSRRLLGLQCPTKGPSNKQGRKGNDFFFLPPKKGLSFSGHVIGRGRPGFPGCPHPPQRSWKMGIFAVK